VRAAFTRGKNMRKEYRKKIPAFYKIARVISIIFLLLALSLVGILIFSGLLALKILVIAIAVIALICLIIFPPLFSYKFKKSRKIIALIFSFLFGAAFLLGIIYLGSTIGFLDNITTMDIEPETYYVVVRDDDEYKELKDISGETVEAYGKKDNLDKACNKLKEKVSCEIEKTEDLVGAASDLTEGKSNVLFLISEDYKNIAKEKEGFDDDTKILYKIRLISSGLVKAKHVNVSKESFNVLISGVDSYGAIYDGRSDVNMVATVDPKNRKVLLTTIPRDYYLPVAGKDGSYDKLTHFGLMGTESLVKAVEDLLGIEINYYSKVNFSTLVELVDAVGGITVYSDYDFTSKVGNYTYVAGENYLNGEEALAFARERYAFADGDFQRNKNQQAVIEGLINKLSGSTTLLLKYTSILNSLGDSVDMNMPPSDIKALVRMQTGDMKSWDVEKQNITGQVSTEYCYALGDYASVVLQDPESVAAASKAIKAFGHEETN
jgi:LCP family protein required for cell wall assembly